MERTIEQLTSRFPRTGRVDAIVLRPERHAACVSVAETIAQADIGLTGDHRRGGKRQVSLIQAEHLVVVAALLGRSQIEAIELRRNLVISGINLISLKSLFLDLVVRVRIGQALLELTGDCDPCSRMEEALGEGGYNAMRGHGGMVARILESGRIGVGDAVTAVVSSQQATLV